MEELVSKIIDCAWEVRKALTPGYLESIYEKALLIELNEAGLQAQAQVPIKVTYKGKEIGDFRADIIVENKVIVELKACKTTTDAFKLQLINYLQATGIEEGILLNFGEDKFFPIRKSKDYHPERYKKIFQTEKP